MKLGTKSILFGVHQILIHSIVVWLAWIKLYGLPSFKELICIIIHDWGYYGKDNIDGPEGKRHPELGAKIAGKLFGKEYYDLCLYHSRFYANRDNVNPSKLCWADKYSIKLEPYYFYVCRAIITGEMKEFREVYFSKDLSNKEWFQLGQELMSSEALEKSKAYNSSSFAELPIHNTKRRKL